MYQFSNNKRNFDGIEFESLRKKIDVRFNKAHDELSDAYYNYWKSGHSKPFYGYNVQTTPEASKELFDKLHNFIFLLRDTVLEEEHLKLVSTNRDSRLSEYFTQEITNKDGVTKTNSEFTRETLQNLKDQGINPTI